LFKVPVKVLELVRQIAWSKGDRYASKLDLYQRKMMELHEKVKKNPRTEYSHLLVDVF